MPQRKRSTAVIGAGFIALALAITGCTADTGSEGPVTLKWVYWDIAVPDAVVEAFEAENPDIKVEATQQAYNDYLTALRPSLTSDSGPDIFQVAPGTLVENYGELAEPLDSIAEEAYGSDWKSQFANGSLDALALDGHRSPSRTTCPARA